jgi:hypothetical protein
MGPISNNPDSTGMPPMPPPWTGGPSSPPQGNIPWMEEQLGHQQGNTSLATQSSGVLQPNPEWKVLRILSRVLKIIAWIEAVIGALMIIGWTTLIGAILSNMNGSGSSVGNASYYDAMSTGPIMAISASYIGGTIAIVTLYLLVNTAITFIFTYGIAEAILVFLAIEKNTRKGG